jgi:hypothetical protein
MKKILGLLFCFTSLPVAGVDVIVHITDNVKKRIDRDSTPSQKKYNYASRGSYHKDCITFEFWLNDDSQKKCSIIIEAGEDSSFSCSDGVDLSEIDDNTLNIHFDTDISDNPQLKFKALSKLNERMKIKLPKKRKIKFNESSKIVRTIDYSDGQGFFMTSEKQ